MYVCGKGVCLYTFLLWFQVFHLPKYDSDNGADVGFSSDIKIDWNVYIVRNLSRIASRIYLKTECMV